MEMFNPTLENVKTQCDGYVFVFPMQERVEVPETLAPLIYTQLKARGIFIVPKEESKFEEAKNNALRNYLEGTLHSRIQNYTSEMDELKRSGVTYAPTVKFQRAMRWRDELTKHLNVVAPIDQELSYLDIPTKKADSVTAPVAEQVKRGRPKKVIDSFNDIEINDAEFESAPTVA